MSFSFPRASEKQNGYVPAQVEELIAKAREQHSNPAAQIISANELRQAEFDFEHGGYSISAVDSALDRLEDTFSTRELARERQMSGEYQIQNRLSSAIELIRGRLDRPKGKKFANTGFLLRGYNRKSVDQLCDQIARLLQSGTELNLDSVRRVIFTAKRGGYVESQVDAFIDRVVEVLHIERNS